MFALFHPLLPIVLRLTTRIGKVPRFVGIVPFPRFMRQGKKAEGDLP